MAQVAPVTLEGGHVTLAPLSQSHRGALAEAVRDGELWKLWYTTIPAPDDMAAEIARRLALQAEGRMLPFAVLDASGRAVGMTSYTNIDHANKRLEIGWTWYRAAAQRTPLNTEAKLLLLTHAFEDLNCIAVELRTHVLNVRSRAAIERLGARLDGILRHHTVLANGTIRDTAVYSITAPEWPAVKANLAFRLESASH